ncbi:helix-turn-helix domain-containing protein [Arthrobacter sp. CG_A4]|uniref:helix-turn-helix domain-containing protein n=1 Tax=Arthrobacter sp. CG_A4 TaxID=3071706 RepID=UPI002E0415DB|nr:AraC-like DNA-binding protein [Arthrobacter sp. CG_A4]
MLYEEWPAPPDLQPYVAAFWLVRGRPAARYEKILPGPFAHLVLNLSEPYRLIETHPRDPASGSTSGHRATEVAVGFYSGLQRSFLISENPARIFNIGAVLAPFGLAAFTAEPPSALQGTVVDAERIFPGFSSLRAGLADPTPSQAFAALGTFLAARLRPGFHTDQRAVSAASALAAEDLRVAALAARLGVNESTLERIMLRDCGVGPKTYSDVCRFHRFVTAAAALPKGAAAGRALLALADYYDQPHLIRAFRRFAGYTPSEYLKVVHDYGPEYATFVPLEDVPGMAPGERTGTVPGGAGFIQDRRAAGR